MKLLLLIPDGVGARNFLLGRFLHLALEEADVSILHVVPDHLLAACNAGLNGHVEWRLLRPLSERPVAYTLRYALAYAQMYWADTRAISARNPFLKRVWVDSPVVVEEFPVIRPFKEFPLFDNEELNELFRRFSPRVIV